MLVDCMRLRQLVPCFYAKKVSLWGEGNDEMSAGRVVGDHRCVSVHNSSRLRFLRHLLLLRQVHSFERQVRSCVP